MRAGRQIVLWLLGGAAFFGLAVAMEQTQKSTSDCCRDVGTLIVGIEAALPRADDVTQKILMGAAEAAGYHCGPTRAPGVWTCR